MSFANPSALLLLLVLLPLLLLLVRGERRRRAADRAWGGRPPGHRRTLSRGLPLLLLAGAIVLGAIGAARPQWGSEERAIPRLGIDVVIALDTSRSMTATDVEPSRAAVAAAGLQEMLGHLRGDRVGLVTFAGTAFERSPLTLDLDAVAQLVGRAQGETALVQPGTALAEALARSLEVLAVSDPADTQVIVLVSDGEELGSGLDEALAAAAERGVRVYAAAVGTEDGGTIPPRDGETVDGTDGAADPRETSRANRETLEAIASATGGELRELPAIAGLAVEFQRLRQSQFDEGVDQAPIERSTWFFGGAVALLAIASLLADLGRGVSRRRMRIGPRGRSFAGALLAPAIVLAALAVACGASTFHDVERGNEAYAEGDFETAAEAYREAVAAFEADGEAETPDALAARFNLGNALHQLGRYDEATAASFAVASTTEDAALHVDATYALGNHAFRSEDFEAAREAYTAALLRDPADADAKHNLELTLQALGIAPVEPPPAEGTAEPGSGEGEGAGDGGSPAGQGDEAGEGASEQPGGEDPAGGDEGALPGEDQPPGDGTPPGDGSTGAPPGGADPGGGAPPADGVEGSRTDPGTLEAAEQALSEALLELGDELTLDEAFRLLELTRRLSELSALEPRAPIPGIPDR